MRSLLSLLEGAVRQGASEVMLESGQPVVYTTARGSVAESSVLPRTELFDMIAAAVDDGHQIELAVGNPVEFEFVAGARWIIYAEPGADGFTVHAQRMDGLDIDLDDDELGTDFESEGAGSWEDPERSPYGFAVEEPQFDIGLDDPPPPPPPPPSAAARPRSPSAAPPSQLYVEALDVPAVDESGTAEFEPVGAAFESGTWALEDDDEFDVGLDEQPDASQLPTGFAASKDFDNIGVPDDDDDDDGQAFSDPFGDSGPILLPSERARMTHSPTVRAMEASHPTVRPNPPPPPQAPAPPPPPGADPMDDGVPRPRARDISDRITVRDMGAVGSQPETRRELPSASHSQAAEYGLIADVPDGTLVFVREPGFADTIARQSQAASITIGDPHEPTEVWSRVRTLPVGSIIIVRCEDPSMLLDGILRRLEEGYRVLVETRARTIEGARRVLLGVSATERAERWLNAQATLTVEPSESGPRLVKA